MQVSRSRFIGDLKLLWNYFFYVSTLNSKGGALSSARVSDCLKMRKSLPVHYGQDILFLLSISIIMFNNVIMLKISLNFEEFQLDL